MKLNQSHIIQLLDAIQKEEKPKGISETRTIQVIITKQESVSTVQFELNAKNYGDDNNPYLDWEIEVPHHNPAPFIQNSYSTKMNPN